MKLYRTTTGAYVEADGSFYRVTGGWDELMQDLSLLDRVAAASNGVSVAGGALTFLAPVQSQEVWAAGVTYYRSRSARIEESKDAGGGTFYDRVYSAARPELFFKASGRRVVGPGGVVRIRSDAKWSVPEPELTLVVNPAGKIIGYTIGNDMSSRDIEGENPLYLPQAKVYDGSCAIGPCILLGDAGPNAGTSIRMAVMRGGKSVFEGSTTLAELKRAPEELIAYLFRDATYPDGVLLMTGTGIVPDDEFTLASGDLVRIEIEGIGLLENTVG